MSQFIPDTQITTFVESEFGAAVFGDKRLERRFLSTVEHLTLDPSRSIPNACGNWNETKAAYRLFSNLSIDRKKVLEPHFQATVERIKDEKEILVSSDTMFLNYTDHPALQGIGPIGSKKIDKLKGVLVHSGLAITTGDHCVLGLLDQEVIIRNGYRADKSHSSKKREDLESQKWTRVVKRTVDRVGEPEKLIFVFDREGDIFDVIEEMKECHARFVVRASSNRRLKTKTDEKSYIFDAIRATKVRATKTITIPAGGGRKARQAKLSIRAKTYEIMPPKRREPKGEPLEINVVHVTEQNPPNGSTAFEWTLLTSEPINTTKALYRVVAHYCGRWKIEELHKGLKTGCKMEERQLESWEAMDVLLGIFSVLAWRLLSLRDAARAEQRFDKNECLTKTQVAVLQAKFPELKQKNDARSYLVSIAKLGGFLARKSDGDPGWITLWRGMFALNMLEQGYMLR